MVSSRPIGVYCADAPTRAGYRLCSRKGLEKHAPRAALSIERRPCYDLHTLPKSSTRYSYRNWTDESHQFLI